MSACEFVGSNVDFYVPLVLKRADLFLAADLFLECLDLLMGTGNRSKQQMSQPSHEVTS